MSLTSFVRFSSSDEVVSSGHFQPDSKVSQKSHGPNMLTTQIIKSGEKDTYPQELQGQIHRRPTERDILAKVP